MAMGVSTGWIGRDRVFDIALALGVAILVMADALLAAEEAGGLTVLDYALLLVAALSLIWRRDAPRVVLVVATVCIVAYLLRSEPSVIPVVPILVAKYTAVSTGHRFTAVVVVSPVVLGAMIANLTGGDGQITREVISDTILPVGWFSAAWVLGEVTRHRAAYVHEVEKRAAEAERTRDEVAKRQATEERLRIARELHDSLTHSISVIKVHAGVAVHLARKRSEAVPDALLAIQEASGEATRELRSTLEVLREPATSEDEAPHGPEQLTDLIQRVRTAGLPVTLQVIGERPVMSPDVDRTVFRIVQEALTNVARHGGGDASASVRIEYGRSEVMVQVDDDGRATPDAEPIPGNGLLGMRERVVGLGGQLRAQPRADGGFSVRAELPLREEAPTS